MLRSPAKHNLVLGLLLVLVTLVVYNPVSHHGFVSYDDDRYVTDNPQVRAGLTWATVSWAFKSFEQANWHPLTWLSHALDCQLFHLNPAGHHFTSLLLHALNALLLFLILQWFTRYTGRSLMVAALFAVHPLNVESVAWVAERKSVLSMLFFLLALAAYGWYVRRPSVGRYLMVAVLFAAGLMSKPMVITLPFVLLLMDYWPLGRMRLSDSGESPDEVSGNGVRFAVSTRPLGRLCLEKIPLLLLSAGSAIITMLVQRVGGAVISSTRVSLVLRLENAILCYGLYLKKAVWPSHLAVIYPYPHALPAWQAAASALFLLAVTWAVLKYRMSRYLLVGWFWYLGTMVPMIGLVQVGNQAMADRYAYLPLIGLFAMIVWAAADWASARHLETKYLATVGFIVLVALSAVTRIQLRYWQNDFSLWTHALAINPHNFVAENNFGLALIRQGRRDEAIPHFRAAAAIEPRDPTSQFNLGVYAQEQGDLKQAAARYEFVLQLTADTQLRSSAYANLGTVYFALRNYTRAQQNYESAIKLNRVFPVALRDMGLIALKNGDWNQAIHYFAWLLTIAPSDVDYLLLSQAFHQSGRDENAKSAYQQALRFSRDINQAQQMANQLAAQ